MKGKIIVLDGVDASGKATQAKKLTERLLENGYKAKLISFPDYNSPSSSLIKMYLNGEFGTDPDLINPKAISACYALDRFASTFKWRDFYDNGGILVMDRYVSSNMIHQASKIKSKQEKINFLNWLYDFEYNILNIPLPDEVIFLDMPPEKGLELLSKRMENKAGTKGKDIHEKNEKYLKDSYDNAVFVANLYNWKRISCVTNDNSVKDIEAISDEIWNILSMK